MKEFLKNGYLCIPFEEDILSKVSKILYGNISITQSKTVIYGNSKGDDISSLHDPYRSAHMLGLHSEGLGEDVFGKVLGIGLFPTLFPLSGGQTLLCNTVNLVRELPLEIRNLSFLFSFQGKKSLYPLVIKHPIYGFSCLNFSLYGYNLETQEHDYISFPNITDSRSIFVELYNLIEKYTISIDIPQGSCLYFDNFLVLHGRASFFGERKVERYSLFI